jgi:hypothetical protein
MQKIGPSASPEQLFFAPLIKIGHMYVEECAGGAESSGAILEASDAIARLVCGACSYAEAAEACRAHLHTDAPAWRMQMILSIACGELAETPPMPRKLSKRCRLWCQEDDIRLLAGIRRYGVGAWKQIAAFVGRGKSSGQCSQRWSRALNPALSKEHWTDDQDRALWALVGEHGEHSWARIAKEIGSRSDVQCRYRFALLRRSRKFEEPQHPAVRLIRDPFQLAIAELMPPLVVRRPHASVE